MGKCSRNTIGGPKCDQISFTGVAAVLFVQSEELVDQKFRHSPQYLSMAPLIEMLFSLPNLIEL